MLRNYLVAALRNLFRNRAYAAINLCGLTLGFVVAILIALFVRYEYSYDRFFPDHDRIFQVQSVLALPGQAPVRSSVIPARVAAALELDFPSIESTARLAFANVELRYGAILGRGAPALWADPEFFDLFPLKVLSGSLAGAMKQPDTVVLTRSMARYFFSRDDVAGNTLDLDQQNTMRIAAVVDDLPLDTHLQGNIFISGVASFSQLSAWDAQGGQGDDLNNRNAYTYVRLRPGASAAELNRGLQQFVERQFPGEINGVRVPSALTLHMVPIAELHLGPDAVAAKPSGDARTVNTMIVIGLLVLLVAASNFVSMMTARASGRGIEIGVRKIVGATRGQIIVQFVCECLFYVFLAMIFAAVVVAQLMPAFNAFVQREISFDLLRDPLLLAGLVGATLVVGLVAGLYPGIVLSSFRPNKVLKGAVFDASGSGRLRELLVIFQFGTLVAMTVATLTVHRQTQYAIEDRLRAPGNQIFIQSQGCSSSFAERLKEMEGVQAVSCVGNTALSMSHLVNIVQNNRGEKSRFAFAQVDYGFFDVFGIKPLAGRVLAPQFGEDDLLRAGPTVTGNPSIVINETGARALGFTPQSAVGQSVRWPRLVVSASGFNFSEDSSRIAGVISDFPIGSVKDLIEPTAYYMDPSMFNSLLLGLDGASVPETLRAVRAEWSKTRSQPFEGRFLSQYLDDLYADIKKLSIIFSLSAAVAIVVSALGLIGLAIFTAERRTREIGLRIVMGATRWDILRFLGWQFFRPLLWANAIAWPVAYYIMHLWLQGFAYHVDVGIQSLFAASALAMLVALATVLRHAFRVARTAPVMALRYE